MYLPQRRKIFLLFRIFPIDFILTLVYNKSIKKGGDKVKKKKKKIKPGYKKKIDWAIAEKNKKERKIERRQQSRTARKNKKNSHK